MPGDLGYRHLARARVARPRVLRAAHRAVRVAILQGVRTVEKKHISGCLRSEASGGVIAPPAEYRVLGRAWIGRSPDALRASSVDTRNPCQGRTLSRANSHQRAGSR